MYFVWIVILLAHGIFRRSIGEKVRGLPLRLRFFPISTLLSIVVLVAIAISTAVVDGLNYSIPSFAVILAATSLLYWALRRRRSV